jgi:hypothetical protein
MIQDKFDYINSWLYRAREDLAVIKIFRNRILKDSQAQSVFMPSKL